MSPHGRPPICEIIKDSIPVQDLFDELRPHLEKLPPFHRSPAFGGWALQSTNGSYQDGWTMDFCPFNGPANRGPSWHPRDPEEAKIPPIQDYVQPTEIQTPLLAALFTKLNQLGLNPRRARIIRLMPNSRTVWHQDGSPRIYQARLHIPLVTNPGCFFETDQGAQHMPADGSLYFVHINRFHRAVNNGDSIRYHFVCHIWDTRGITHHHRYDPSLCDFEAPHSKDVDPRTLFRPEGKV